DGLLFPQAEDRVFGLFDLCIHAAQDFRPLLHLQVSLRRLLQADRPSEFRALAEHARLFRGPDLRRAAEVLRVSAFCCVKILLPTVYEAIGGSTRVLQAARRALARDHETIVRAPFSDADERLPYFFPADTVESVGEKLRALPGILNMAFREASALRGRGFDVIYVHDEPSLYVYGVAARFLGAKVVRHSHLRSAGSLEPIRRVLANEQIY